MANDIFNYCVATNTGKGLVVILVMYGLQQIVLNQDIGLQETMVFLKLKQKHKLL